MQLVTRAYFSTCRSTVTGDVEDEFVLKQKKLLRSEGTHKEDEKTI